MSFSFGRPGAFGGGASATSGSGQVQMGPDLEEISTEALGFLSLSRDAKIRLLSTPWPSNALPPPTSSLLSIASTNGLVAAAGPDALILASTESVRQAFSAEVSGGSDVKPFSPQLTINLPMRVSQVAFSSDENYLVISAESGGGLAVYDVRTLMQGSTQSSFELSTNGLSLRALSPNPTVAELFALVTTDGHLMMANLKERQFVSGPGGQLLKNGVSCVSWSTRGKQLVAGLADGTAYQMTPEGGGKAEIPKPQGLEGDHHVSSITWLENNIFLTAHTPTTSDSDVIPMSTFHLVTRQPPSYLFQKLADPSPPFGVNRSPPHHFMLRLKDFPPNLQDLVVVSSTASIDIGLFTRSKAPLSKDVAAEKITDIFTMTGMANDTRRASLPMSEDLLDTSPIGLAFDLSAKEKVQRPIAGEEMNESATPLPALVVLNNEGVLAGWWIVYSEAVRQGIAYPGLAASGGGQRSQTEQPKTPFGAPAQQQTAAFGQPTFGSPTAANNAFGTPNKPATPTFGAPSIPGALGGNRGSLWGSPATANMTPQAAGPTFGRPTFGSSTPLGGGGGFGAIGALGTNRSSPWAAAAAGTTPATGSTFGQTNSFGAPAITPLGGIIPTKPPAASTSGFGSWANQGGFAAAAAQRGAVGNSFGSGSPFATGTFGGGMDTTSSFSTGASPARNSTEGLGGSGFKLESAFKPDNTEQGDTRSPTDPKGSLFDKSFGTTLTQTQNKPSTLDIKEADMDIENVSGEKGDTTGPSQNSQPLFSTPTSTPPALKVSTPGTMAAVSAMADSKSGSRLPPEVPNKLEPTPPLPPAPFPPSPKIKSEPREGPRIDASLLEPPLPPDSTSKTTFQAGDSSGSSSFKSIDEPPLPPDFIAPKLSPGWVPPTDIPGGPSEDEGHTLLTSEGETARFDDEGSGEDVAQDLSPITDRNESRGITPQSSFAHSTFSKESSFDESPVGGQFSIVPRQYQPQHPSLFGEVIKPVPYLPPSTSRVPQSPRSPSPVKSGVPGSVLRPDASRPISAISQPSEMRHALIGPPLLPPQRVPAKQLLEDTEEELTDREDEKIRAELATEVEGTTALASFTAHQDYVGDTTRKGIPGQIEKVYRDINSMIDTLGLNARSLEAFTKGHSDRKGRSEHTKDDLETDENWILVEIDDLTAIEDDLSDRLESNRIQDWEAQCRVCVELESDLVKGNSRWRTSVKITADISINLIVRAKYNEVRRAISAASDPGQIEIRRSAPLSAQQAFQQNELRKQSTVFQKLLVETEEGIALLKAKLVSTSGKTSGKLAAPTVEAVMNTILKMTTMVEKRSGDVDLLENQMRKLGLNPMNRNGVDSGTGGISSTTPPPSTPDRPGSGTYGLFYTPGSAYGTPKDLRSSLGGLAVGSPDGKGTPRKKLNAITPEEVEITKEKMARKRLVTKRLRDALVATSPKVRVVEE
ncbi:MAG: hypothetical protein M1839_006283 [Geoglossum umbratile]|nr:MAG: hypothetical protein M1839_006283 [Geoglossum umbratile]